jgi:hypothetical protein
MHQRARAEGVGWADYREWAEARLADWAVQSEWVPVTKRETGPNAPRVFRTSQAVPPAWCRRKYRVGLGGTSKSGKK